LNRLDPDPGDALASCDTEQALRQSDANRCRKWGVDVGVDVEDELHDQPRLVSWIDLDEVDPVDRRERGIGERFAHQIAAILEC
jgi:hypothetical protein